MRTRASALALSCMGVSATLALGSCGEEYVFIDLVPPSAVEVALGKVVLVEAESHETNRVRVGVQGGQIGRLNGPRGTAPLCGELQNSVFEGMYVVVPGDVEARVHAELVAKEGECDEAEALGPAAHLVVRASSSESSGMGGAGGGSGGGTSASTGTDGGATSTNTAGGGS